MSLRQAGLVFLGGGLGACARALLLAGFASWNAPFPLIVLLINLLGAFLLGLVYALSDEAGLFRAESRLFIAVGLLGGFTTFSTLGWGADQLIQHMPAAGAAYVALSVSGGLLAAIAGVVAGRRLLAALERAARIVLVRLRQGRRRSGDARRDLRSIELEDEEETA